MSAAADSPYESLRQRYRPAHVRLLLIGESAPDPGAGELRFFFAPTLARADNLFRSVVLALYGISLRRQTGTSKEPLLERLRDDGVWLIDLVPYPVNALSGRERANALSAHVEKTVAAASELQPEGIAVCHGPTFKALAGPLGEAGLPLLHEEPIPFPLGNWRAIFVERLRAAVTRIGWQLPPA